MKFNEITSIFNKPIRSFIICFILFLIFFIGGSYFPKFYKLINQRYDWIFFLGMIMSSVFAAISIVGLKRQYGLNKSLTAFQIIVLAFSISILLILFSVGLFILMLEIWGFPIQA